MVVARLAVPIDLVDLVGVAARRFGLTQEIGTTTDYGRSQQWARALYERYETLVGLRWRGRQAGAICVALTDRCPMRGLVREIDLPITDASVWPRMARAARRCRVTVI